ncbi:hypothetical protein DM02DRAFT_610734 [Periconia macrospinosa]|uniref:Uncharacterized protein n=1 Tax=Periconia macrospinosa TaxID=97972 RepID=A0A2V1E5S2_9PLEO|nr:hypothetical protein DM02DRAFT_610734 [Periconia macrospinosa]
MSRYAHLLLALGLLLLIVHAVWSCILLLIEDAKPKIPVVIEDKGPRIQDIAQSFNTYWNSWDPDHCRNICTASKRACQLWDCADVPGVKQWD